MGMAQPAQYADVYATSALVDIRAALLAGAEGGLDAYVTHCVANGWCPLIPLSGPDANDWRSFLSYCRTIARGNRQTADLRDVFASLVAESLTHQLAASFMVRVFKLGVDKRHDGRIGRYGREGARWISYLVTSIGDVCQQIIRDAGDHGAIDATLFLPVSDLETARRDAHKRDTRAWHQLQDAMAPMRTPEYRALARHNNRAGKRPATRYRR